MLNLSSVKMACKALHHLAPAQLSSLISQFCLPLDDPILALILLDLPSKSSAALLQIPLLQKEGNGPTLGLCESEALLQ